MNFELALTDEKVKPHQITALHLLSAFVCLGTGALFYWLYLPVKGIATSLMIGGVLLLIVTIAKNKWLLRPATNRVFRLIEILAFGSLAIFVLIRHWWAPGIMFGILTVALLLALTWERSNSELVIHIDNEGIKLPISSRKRFIGWTETDNVILRFGTLTVDCTDKRLYQWNVRGNFDITTFEQFCIQQIEEHRAKRRKDDW